MELVVAVLILIGAMVAGSTSPISDEGSAERDPVTESEQTSATHRVETMLGPCRFPDGRLIQRDLTLPTASTTTTSATKHEEAGHGCADH
jgi:hypothetical protein